MDHREKAEQFLEDTQHAQSIHTMTVMATSATAHAVLALIDYLQQDDNQKEEDTGVFEYLQGALADRDYQIRQFQEMIRKLEKDLEGANAALRAREEAAAAEMKNVHWSTE